MKRERNQSSQKEIIEEIPLKQSKTASQGLSAAYSAQNLAKHRHKEVTEVKVMSKVRVSINVSPNYYFQSQIKDRIPKLLPDAKRRLIYMQNYFLDKVAVMNFKTGKIIKNLGPDNHFHKKLAQAGIASTMIQYYYRDFHFLNEDTLIALRNGKTPGSTYLARINLNTFHFEDIDLNAKIPELEDVIIFDQYPVSEIGQMAIASEIRQILLIDPEKGVISQRYNHQNEIIFGVCYYPKRKWIIGESRPSNPQFLIFDLESGILLKIVDLKPPQRFSGVYGQNSNCMLDYLVMLMNAPRLVRIHEDGTLDALDKDINLSEVEYGGDPKIYHFSADEKTQNVFCSSFSEPLRVYNHEFDLYKTFALDTCCTSVCVMFSSKLIAYFNYKKKTIGFCRVSYRDPLESNRT